MNSFARSLRARVTAFAGTMPLCSEGGVALILMSVRPKDYPPKARSEG